MMEKFTKSTWQVKGDWMIVDSTDRLIAQFEPLNDELSNGNTPESFANAALIAAAPEMYAEVKEYTSLLNALINDGYIGYVERRNAAVELLSKARGEQ